MTTNLFGLPGARCHQFAALREWSLLSDAIRNGARSIVHVSATSSMTRAVRDASRKKEPSINLLTLLEWMASPVPGSDFKRRLYWSTNLEQYLRGRSRADAQTLWSARQSLLDAIVALEEHGVSPEDFHGSPGTSSIEGEALAAWRHLRSTTSLCTHARESVWEAKDDAILRAIRAELAKQAADGSAAATAEGLPEHPRDITLAFHGFYYYTPRQWAFFRQALAAGFDCVFLVHDDGISPEFETWRTFFTGTITSHPVPAPLTRPAAALRAALCGKPLDLTGGDIVLREFRNAGEFLRHPDVRGRLQRRRSTEAPAPDATTDEQEVPLYAADIGNTRRFFRLMNHADAYANADLGSLPAGRLLLKLHDAVHTDVDGQTSFRLTHDIVRDAFDSGYLTTDGLLPIYLRVAGYFEGCVTMAQWLERADALIAFDAAARSHEGGTPTAIARVTNPLRRFPWGDLQAGEATLVHDGLAQIRTQLEALFGDPNDRSERDVTVQLARMRKILEDGLSKVPPTEQQRVRDMLHEMYDPSRPALELRATLHALLDTIRGFLSPKHDDDAEEDRKGDVASPLRSLDAYILAPRNGPLHLVTMADLSFPTRVEPVKWPFRLDSIDGENASEDGKQAKRLFEARRTSATQSDLYLLHVALQPGHSAPREFGPITISWVAEWFGKTMGPSPFVNLLRKLDATVDGVDIHRGFEEALTRDVPSPVPVRAPVPSAPVEIPRGAIASAHHCRRRFLLQWVAGRTVAFTAPHHHAILYGNVNRVLGGHEERGDTRANLATPFLVDGAKKSSLDNTRYPATLAGGAWLLTLNGSQDRKDSLSKSYQFAKGSGVLPDGMSGAETSLVPGAPTNTYHNCEPCPVRGSCIHGYTSKES